MNKTIVETIVAGKSELKHSVKSHESLTLVLFVNTVGVTDVSVTVTLVGIGASVKIIGIVIGKKDSRIKFHTMQIHEAQETTSDLLVKTVLSGHAAFLYDGGIRVDHTAQKTDAYQRNENLLLSDHAYAESKPSLEILANDVRCTHGATVGPINEDQLWYLTSRGISKKQAVHMIAKGFIESALDRMIDKDAKRGIISLWRNIRMY